MKHIFKKLHKSHDPNRTTSNETLTLTPPSSSSPSISTSSPQSQPSIVDHGDYAIVGNPNSTSPPSQSPPQAVAIPKNNQVLRGDYFSSEEDFQMQLALAISASNSEFRGDPENDQIRAATLLSLGRSNLIDNGRDKEVSGEALSRRYWDYHVIDYEEKIVDGFYDAFGLSMVPSISGRIPSLADLETNAGDSGFEAVIVNRTIDPILVELEQVAHCIAIDCPSEIGMLVQRLAELVTDHMGGPEMKDANIVLARWMEISSELRTSLHTSVFPIGSVKVGLSRHRALLFKVLADNVGIKCRLVKGSHYTGVEDDAVNIIKMADEREFLVDLMAAPGTLIPADVLSAKDSSISSFNQRLNKLPSSQASNDFEVPYSRPKPLLGNNSGPTRVSAVEHNLRFDKNSGAEKMELLPSSSGGSSDLGAGPSKMASKSNLPNQLDLPSTSAVGASLFKPNRGALAVGDGTRLNINVVPYNQGHIDDSKNLFAELNPFYVRGSGQPSQQNKPEYKVDDSQRLRNDAASGRPPPHMMWKNHQAINDIPRKKEHDFVEGLLPRTNHEDKQSGILPAASSTALASQNVCQNGANGAVGNSVSVATTAHDSTLIEKHQSSDDGNALSVNDWQGKAASPGNIPILGKERKKLSAGLPIDKKGARHEFIGTGLILNDSGRLSPSMDPGASVVDPVLDDVGECEILWEDLVIGERIGLGSYGEVYHADWNGTEVAVKKFLDQDFSGAALAEFKREVRIMQRLRHPNVVLFMGAVTRPPNLSIVTEFLPSCGHLVGH